MTEPKIIQVSLAGSGVEDSTNCLVVLRDDGTLWIAAVPDSLKQAADVKWHHVGLPPTVSLCDARLAKLVLTCHPGPMFEAANAIRLTSQAITRRAGALKPAFKEK
jgi:hypothetical protein